MVTDYWIAAMSEPPNDNRGLLDVYRNTDYCICNELLYYSELLDDLWELLDDYLGLLNGYRLQDNCTDLPVACSELWYYKQ
jgi:hypothetical protein